ncbi:MAG TPA: hypothetical protein VE133_03440 [Candidatus Sulfotelmatobacter sp.]|nr:hypothetical protein [Candidatus Sulfotelmatobacter sp.]
MALRRFSLFVAVAIIFIALAGCGGDQSLRFPPPTGSFTNASLIGPFAFSYTGSDGGGFLAVAGSFQADGAGHITSGMQDVNSGLGIFTNSPVTGTYTVRADGRGSANLSSPAGNSVIDFVIVAGGHALITRFDANATGSGTLDQQTTSAFSNTALAGLFAFNLSGIDAVGNPLAVAGNFTSDTTGAITAGVDDSNDNGGVVASDPLTGSIPVGANGRGTATMNTVRGALTFTFYVVDANHLKLVETDNSVVLGGEAFRQTGPFSNASVSGPFAFTLAGADVLSVAPFAAGGVLTSNGAGTITGGTEDFNDAGTVTLNVGLTGSYSIAPGGRGTLQIVTGSGTFNFVIYPSSGGVLALETDLRFVTTGTALPQQTAPFSNASFSGIYGLNFTGVSTNGELDSIAQFTADGASRITGIIDINNVGAITFGQPLSGTFSASANGRTTLALQSPLGTQNMAVYLVNNNRALFIELDSSVVLAGDIRHQ